MVTQVRVLSLTMHTCTDTFSDASDFLRKHPWPGRAISDTFDDSNHRKRSFSKKFLNAVQVVCGKTGDEEEVYDEDDREDERLLFDATETRTGQPFYWTPALQDNFREELEKWAIIIYFIYDSY